MPFQYKKVLEHGTTNPIVARLSLQIFEILKQCNASEDMQVKVRELYVDSLLKKLMRCWEIEERFKEEFADAVAEYKPLLQRMRPSKSHRSPALTRSAITFCMRQRTSSETFCRS